MASKIRGKSLTLCMLEDYYDYARKDAFDDLFGQLASSVEGYLMVDSGR